MFMAIILFASVSFCTYAFYKWATRSRSYFVRHKVKHLKPNFLIGNTLGLYLNRYPSHIFMDKIYNSRSNEKLIGFFDFRQPTYMVCDAELINQIGISKFDNFVDRGSVMDIETGVLYGRSLVLLCGDEWRSMRSTLSPTFTCNKLRRMFEFVDEAAQKLVKNLIEKAQENGGQICYEMEQLFAYYSTDFTASCFLSLEMNSFENSKNEFLKNAKDGVDFGGFQSGLRVILLAMFPKLMQAINLEMVSQRIKTYFKSIVLDVMDQRTEKRIFRPDLINTLMRIRNERLKCQKQTKMNEMSMNGDDINHHWTDDELVAQFFIICISSLDSVADIAAFMAYELAINHEIQQKLYDEIQTVNDGLDHRFSFAALINLKYLDQVTSETLRKYPVTPLTTRKCTKDVNLDLGDGEKVHIERGMGIWIPISSVQSDPKYFENPNKFDPERFNEKNKRKIKAGSYIPFGIGPRTCIGQKFALMAIKILFFNLLLNFTIEPYEGTQIPLEFANTVFLHKPKMGIHLKLKLRD